MSWFAKLTAAPAPEQRQAPASAPGGKWWDQLTSTPGPSIGPAEPLPYSVIEDESKMAGAGTQAAASLPTDPEVRAQYFAKQRGIPLDRYFYQDERLAYKADDGKAYYEEPQLRAPTSSQNISQYPKAVASGAGPAMPMIGGVAGGIAAMGEGPAGWGTAIPQAAAGGAIGDMARQFLANKVTGEKKPFIDRAMQTGGAALQEGVGQLFGNAGSKALSVFGRTPAFNIPETTRLRASAEKFGIPLTAGEETGNRTLIRRQKILGNTTEGEQRFTDFYNGRNESVGNAVNQLLGKISPQASPRMGSQSGVEGAQSAVDKAVRDLSDRARPAYKEADQGMVSLEQLLGGPASGRIDLALNAVQKMPVYKDTISGMPTNSIPVVDAAKKYLDDKVGAALRAGNKNEARLWNEAADELRTIADANVPKYGEARGIFEAGVPGRDAVTRGVVGDVAKLEGTDTLRAASTIFGKGSSPEDVKLARSAFEKAGAGQNWDDLLRAHLQQVFEEIPDSSVGAITNIGGSYRKAILGNKRKREMLEAAFSHRPELWNETLDLMQVLDATGRAMKGESITAFAQAGQKDLAREGGGLGPAVLETIELWRTPSRIAKYWADMNTSKYAARQAELLTTPEGRNVLREIKKLGPTSAGSVIALSHFLTGGAAAAGSDLLNQKPDGPVSATGNTSRGPTR